MEDGGEIEWSFYGVGVGSMQEEKFDKEAKEDGGSMMLNGLTLTLITK